MTIDKSRIQITLPEDVKYIIETLNDAGFDAYAVGGCVRDSLLGKEPKDWDITTSATPLEVKAQFRRTIDTGIQHGTVTIMIGNEGYEVTTYRIDSEYEDMRHPKEVVFTDKLTEDLKRRDFTINAMAYSDKTGLIDEFDGIYCIENKIIRAVGNAHDRMSEDALRILRAIRFSAVLDFEIDEELVEAIKELAPNLSKISAERICAELTKTICSDHPERLIDAYKYGVTKVILPEFDLCMETEQNTPYHIYNVGEHTIWSLRHVHEYKDQFSERENKILSYTMLFHDFGKPASKTIDKKTGYDHFFGHPEVSAEIARNIMHRLKMDNDTINNVYALVKWHDYRPKLTLPKIRRFIVALGRDRMPLNFAVRMADTLSQSDYLMDEKLSFIEEMKSKYEKIISDGDCLEIKELKISGKDIIGLGVKPGPLLGDILDKLLDEVLDDPSKNNEEYLVNATLKYLEKNR